MALTLDIEGEVIQDPNAAQIAEAFHLLAKGSGFLGPGITIATLSRAEAEFLMATGTRDAGFALSYQDGNPAWQYEAGPEQGVTFDEVIGIFQNYSSGANWGQTNFKWEREQLVSENGPLIKRLLFICLIGFITYIVVRKFIVE